MWRNTPLLEASFVSWQNLGFIKCLLLVEEIHVSCLVREKFILESTFFCCFLALIIVTNWLEAILQAQEARLFEGSVEALRQRQERLFFFLDFNSEGISIMKSNTVLSSFFPPCRAQDYAVCSTEHTEHNRVTVVHMWHPRPIGPNDVKLNKMFPYEWTHSTNNVKVAFSFHAKASSVASASVTRKQFEETSRPRCSHSSFNFIFLSPITLSNQPSGLENDASRDKDCYLV